MFSLEDAKLTTPRNLLTVIIDKAENDPKSFLSVIPISIVII